MLTENFFYKPCINNVAITAYQLLEKHKKILALTECEQPFGYILYIDKCMPMLLFTNTKYISTLNIST